jgi:tetratricopeptide (TPR) repeat protein
MTPSGLTIALLVALGGAGLSPASAPQSITAAEPRLDVSASSIPASVVRRAEIDAAIQARDWELAERLIADEIERQPRSRELLVLVARIFFLDGKPLNSAVALKKAEARAPLDRELRLTLALAYIRLGRGDWARPELKRLVAADPNEAGYRYWIGRLDYDAGKYAAAIARFNEALARDPRSVRAHDNLGLCYEALDEPDQAVAHYREAIRLNRQAPAKSPWPPTNLGILLRSRGDVEEAGSLFREALQYDPNFANAHYQLGLLLEHQRRIDDAASALAKAAAIDPTFPEPHYALARVYRRRGEPARAAEALEAFHRLRQLPRTSAGVDGGERVGESRRAKTAPPKLVDELTSLLERGELVRAKTMVGDALRQYPSDAAVHNIAGAIDAQQRVYESAERHFRTAIRIAPKITAPYVNLGRLYQEHAAEDPQALQKAIAVYRELLQFDPTNSEALFQCAYVSARVGDWVASRGLLERLPAQARARPQALAVLAVDLAGTGESARAQEAATQLLAHADLTEEDVLAVVPALERAKDDGLAERLLTGLDRRGLASTESLRRLGLVYARLGRFGDARQALERAMRSAGAPNVEILIDLARAAYKQKEFEAVLGYLAQARDLDPQNAQVHFFFGIACVELNLGSEAFESLKKAATLAPDNPYVNYALGAVAIHRHEPSEALPYFEAYVRLKPDDPRGRFALGAARFYSNDFDAARADLEHAARFPETAAGAHYFLARIARQLNQLDRARQDIDRALRANPHYGDAWAELGLLQTRSGEYAAAEQSLANALARDAENYAATVNLATLYARTRDPRLEAQKARLDALQQKREAAAQEFLRMIQVVP